VACAALIVAAAACGSSRGGCLMAPWGTDNRPIVMELVHLSRRFGSTMAVANVNVRIGMGEMVGIIGRSGAGKSTLLRLINRMIEPTEGGIRSGGIDITALRGKALRRWRAQTAMIFQQFNLVHRLDVLTNVLCGRLHDISGPRMLLKRFAETERVDAIHALDRMGLAAFAMNRADALSGGQQQRVAIARALMQKPGMILADEPIASLDPMNARLVMESLADINRNDGITVLCNLHTIDTARAYCGRVIGMSAGRIVFDGAPEHLTDSVLRDIYGDHGGGVLDERITSTRLPVTTMAAMAHT
jgi:phosphonate transport system ATP-binding protein